IMVADEGCPHDWAALGAVRSLLPTFSRDDLHNALKTRAIPIAYTDVQADELFADLKNNAAGDRETTDGPLLPVTPMAMGSLLAITGPGGTGASTVAMALGQALGHAKASGPYQQSQPCVLLADLRRHAELAMLHRVDGTGPGIVELIDAHRRGQPNPETIRSLAVPTSRPGYLLLRGLRRSSHWTTIRPETMVATLASLRRTFSKVVCDIDCDFEGEAEGGSLDVEERNAVARETALRCDVVFVVGNPTVKGIHAQVRVVAELVGLGVETPRIVAVVNRAPRSPRQRATIVATTTELVSAATGASLGGLVFLPERPVEMSVHHGTPLPAELGSLLAGTLAAVTRRLPKEIDLLEPAPQLVKAGTLGVWASA
ncbi:MAG: hypothetical protein ACRDRT_11900, partial [Pseudonocardiaceae bacterium]